MDNRKKRQGYRTERGTGESGFTLIELLVVIAIIGLLSTIVVATLSNTRNKSRFTRTVSDMRELAKAADIYNLKHNSYPPNYVGEGDPGFIADGTITVWPKAQCGGWFYDWDNWDHNPTYDANKQIIRITLRKADNSPVYFYCVSTDSDCRSDNNSLSAGTNIQTLSSGTSLVCS